MSKSFGFAAALLCALGMASGCAVAGNSSLVLLTQVAPPAMVAQAATTTKSDMTLGECEDVQTPDNPDGQLGGRLAPAGALQNYWYNKFNEVLLVKDAKVTVLQEPEHGVIQSGSTSLRFGPYFKYTPDHGYLGQDKVTFLVEVGGKSVKVVTTLIVVDVAGLHDSPCFKGVKTISSSEVPAPELATGLATWLSAAQLAGKLTDAGFENK